MALAGRTKQVGSPNKQIAWEVLWVIRVFASEFQCAGFQLFDNIFHRVLARKLCLLGDVQRIGPQLWRRRQPTHAFGADIEVNQTARPLRGIGQRREDFVDRQFFITPLASMRVEE